MPLGGLAVSAGALQVSYSDSHNPYPLRAKRMLSASLLCALAVVVGGLLGRFPIPAIIFPALWAFAAGLAVSLGPAAENIGVISLVTLIIFAAQTLTPSRALLSGVLALGGGLLQTVLALLLWPVRRYQPEQFALAELYGELSRTAIAAFSFDSTRSDVGPPATQQSTAARETLSGLGNDNSLEAARFWSLLNQAERIRLSVLALRRLRRRMARDNEHSPRLSSIDDFLKLTANVLRMIERALFTGHELPKAQDSLRELASLANFARTENGSTSAFLTAMTNDSVYPMDALVGQLRSAVRSVTESSPSGLKALETRDATQRWRQRIDGRLATLRANLSLQSSAFRHALRMSICLAVGEVVAHQLRSGRSYWLAMTIVLVLKQEFTATFSRGVLRILGTIVGLLIATALFHFLALGLLMKILLVALFTFLLRWAGGANYGVFTIAVSALIVLLVAFVGVSPKSVIFLRGEMTLLGGLIALAAYLVWPTWERTTVAATLAAMLESYRVYFLAVFEAHVQDKRNEPKLDRLRMAGRLARSNMDASADRLRVEPGTSSERVQLLTAILANSHRFIRAAMALEVVPFGDEPARKELAEFAKDVDVTLQAVCAALRGEKSSLRNLPDLREDHHRLVNAASSEIVRYALVNEETDRITNSLNTLREQTTQWIRSPAFQ